MTGRVAVHPLGLDGDVQVNRRHHGGEGQAVYAYAQEDADFWAAELDRDLPPGRFGENLRTTGLDLRNAAPRRPVAGRDGAVRGDRLAHSVRELRPLLGRPRPGQAVRRARRHRRLPAGAGDRRDRRRRRASRSCSAPTTGSPWRRPSGSPRPRSRGCPSSRRRCTYLPVKDQPKLRGQDRRTGSRQRLSAPARYCPPRWAGRLPARRGGRDVAAPHGHPRCSRVALLAAPVLTGCGGDAADEESAPDLLARAKTTLDDASSAHFVLDSEGAPESGTVLVGGEGDIARPASFEGTLKVLALGSTPRPRRSSPSTAPSTPSSRSRRRSARSTRPRSASATPAPCSTRRPASPSCWSPRSPRAGGGAPGRRRGGPRGDRRAPR